MTKDLYILLLYTLHTYTIHTHTACTRASTSSGRRNVYAREPAAAPIPYRGAVYGPSPRVVVLGAVYKEIESLKTFAHAAFLTVKSSGSLTLARGPGRNIINNTT